MHVYFMLLDDFQESFIGIFLKPFIAANGIL